MSARPSAAGATGERFAAFDGLRAVAALSVLAYHVSLAGALSRKGTLAPLFGELKAGVAVFFVISGCLLYLPYARALQSAAPLPDWHRYLHRRALRILPGYWVALTILAVGPAAGWIVSANWWRFYGLAQIYDADTVMGGLSVAWSLCVEVTFYAMLPLFAVVLARTLGRRTGTATVRGQLAVLGALAAISFVVRYALAGSLTAPIPHSGFVMATALPGFLDWFAAGMALAVLASAWESGDSWCPRVSRLAGRSTSCWLLATALFIASALVQDGDLFLPLSGLVPHVAVGIAATLVVLPAVAPSLSSSPTGPLALLRHPLALWLGTISYGIYLWHVPLLEALNGSLSATAAHPASAFSEGLLLVAVIAGAVALGAASWYLVERPARRLFTPRPAADAAIVQA